MPEPHERPVERAPRGWSLVVLATLALALGLRLLAAHSTPLTGDELEHVKAALVYRFIVPDIESSAAAAAPYTLNHPLLPVLLIRLPLALGYETDFAVRLPFVALSLVGLVYAYLLAQKGFGRWPALVALALLSVDQFHLIRSRSASEALALAFVAPILYAFYVAVVDDRPNLMALVGALMGVGFFAKEDTLLLLPAFAFFLLVRRSRWRWFRRGEVYVGLLIVGALVGVNAYFNAVGAVDNLARIAGRTAGVGLTLRATSLYLGELLIRLVRDPARFVWQQDLWSWEIPAMNWVAGLVCLAAAIQAAGRYRDELTSLLVTVFWVVFLAVSLVLVPRTALQEAAGAPPPGFWELDLKKWAGTSLIPAALLAGALLYRRARTWRLGQVLAAMLIGYLIGNGVRVALVRQAVYCLPAEVAARRPAHLDSRPAPRRAPPPPARPNRLDARSSAAL